MDIPIKVIFQEYSYGQLRREREAKLFEEGFAGHSGIQVNEYVEIQVRFEAADPQAILFVEGLHQEDDLEIKPGETRVLMQEGDSDDMIVPGEYGIRVASGGRIFESFYEIQPKNYTKEAIRHLRAYLEKKQQGLAYQLMKKRGGPISGQDEGQQLPAFAAMLNQISGNFRRIIHHLEDIMNDPLLDIEKRYQERGGSRRPDFKSQRWLMAKGAMKNSHPSQPAVVFEKHARLTAVTLENQWIKWILWSLKHRIRTIHEQTFDYLAFKEQQYQNKELELQKYGDALQRVQSHPYRSGMKKGEWNLSQDIRLGKGDLERWEAEIDDLREKEIELQRMSAIISRYQQTGWMQEVSSSYPSKVSIRMMKDPRYGFLYRFHQDLDRLEQEGKKRESAASPFKRSSVLMEYFAVILCIEILEKLGFAWTSGWMADEWFPLVSELPPGTVMRFESSERIVELAYDQEMERSHSIDVDGSYSRFVGEVHRKPDIRLSLFDQGGSLIRTTILEVKYRRFHYLWNAESETDVEAQLKAYRFIQYYDAQAERLESKVGNVLVLYPRQENVQPVEYRQARTLAFIQVEPNDPNELGFPFGFEVLENYMNHFLR